MGHCAELGTGQAAVPKNHNPLEGTGRHSVRIDAVEQPDRHPAWHHDNRNPAPVSGGRLTRRRVTRLREARDI